MKNAGYTLIELMTVVTVMGVLAAIAIPTYQNYTLRSNRTVAKAVVLDAANKEESFYVDRKQYATNLQSLGYPGTAGATVYLGRDGKASATNTGDMIFSLALSGASTTAYTVVGTAVNRQTKDADCTAFRADNLGGRTATGSLGNACWK
jgi:type IV pilus assembly protein PilE